jgi:hypothetical protein
VIAARVGARRAPKCIPGGLIPGGLRVEWSAMLGREGEELKARLREWAPEKPAEARLG